LRQDKDVKAIVLRINSPGGSASASGLIAREVKLAATVKPVIASMGSVAASGGYQIATYATQILASPNTITGSSGVFGLVPNVQQISNNNGITWDVVKTGPYADIDTFARPKTPQELAIGQRLVDQIYGQFVDSVAQSRSLPRERVNAIAQGRVWSGLEAKRIGLVDDLGGLNTAIQAAVKAAKLGDDWQIDEYPHYRSFEEQLLGSLLSRHWVRSPSTPDFLAAQIQHLRTELEALKNLNDPRGIYARMIFIPQID